jgi:glutaredoxin
MLEPRPTALASDLVDDFSSAPSMLDEEVRAMMKQQCPLAFVWLTWIGIPLLAILVLWRTGWIAGVVTLLVGVLVLAGYIRAFPRLSQVMGYGSVADEPAAAPLAPRHARRVTLYTARVCPFCPIVRQRLQQLQRDIEFDLEEIDVTFRPHLVTAKGLRSVPVVEAGGRLLSGNATTARLAAFLADTAERHDGSGLSQAPPA